MTGTQLEGTHAQVLALKTDAITATAICQFLDMLRNVRRAMKRGMY
jgi:hypothetical protein